MFASQCFRAAVVVSLLAAAGPALADSWFSTGPRWHRGSTMDPLRDESGIAVLGVDISAGGSTPWAASNFVAGLRPDLQAKVLSGCSVMDPNTFLVNVSVVRFCRALNASRGQ